MKRLLTYIIMLLPLSVMAQTPQQVVQQFMQKLEEKTLASEYAISINDGQAQQTAYSGELKMRGSRFVLTMLETEAAFDGKTLYIYQEDLNELTLSEPSQEELLEANPMLFAKALLKTSALRFSAGTADEKSWSIDFVPASKDAGIQRFVLKLRKSDLLPQEIQIREGKQTTRIRFKNAAFSTEQPAFKLDKKGAFVNDMR